MLFMGLLNLVPLFYLHLHPLLLLLVIGLFDQGFTILGDNIRYTGYKTNGVDTYDSFALSNLQDALVKSFFDPDLQQYATFTTAVE